MPYTNWMSNWFASGSATEANAAASDVESDAAKSNSIQARKSTSSAIGNAGKAAVDETKAAGESIERTVFHTGQSAENRANHIGESAVDKASRAGGEGALNKANRTGKSALNEAHPAGTKAERAATPVERPDHRRPKITSHDSTGDKFKHVLGLDRKQHKAELAGDTVTRA